ncbi:hypothetical protein [Rhizobium sp. Rhizsp82]|uniref:hypothetical protein n=1 Tax=Rhizobium sp. Rhizsp82 TaxID=3243057 RepID=UPI0039B37630
MKHAVPLESRGGIFHCPLAMAFPEGSSGFAGCRKAAKACRFHQGAGNGVAQQKCVGFGSLLVEGLCRVHQKKSFFRKDFMRLAQSPLFECIARFHVARQII